MLPLHRKASACIHAAKAAYTNGQRAVAAQLQASESFRRTMGVSDVTPEMVACFESTSTNTQGFILRCRTAIILAFRGTETGDTGNMVADINTDTNIHFRAMQLLGKSVLVHTGFHSSLLSVIQTVDELRGSQQELWVTGHSLGGALATLAAAHLADSGRKPDLVCTFGCPRVGDADFQSVFNGAFDVSSATKCRAFAFVNNNDVVPTVPTFATESWIPPVIRRYYNVGRLMYINSNHIVIEDPSDVYVSADKALGHMYRIGNDIRSLRLRFDNFDDHGKDQYELWVDQYSEGNT